MMTLLVKYAVLQILAVNSTLNLMMRKVIYFAIFLRIVNSFKMVLTQMKNNMLRINKYLNINKILEMSIRKMQKNLETILEVLS